jgi:hypothetical protein
MSNKDGSYHSQNFVFSIKNFWKSFQKKYSTKYLKKMKNKILQLKTSKGRTIALIKLYTDAPDVWKRSVKAMMQTMVAMGNIDKGDIPKLQMCGSFGPESGKKSNCLKL